MKALQFNSLAKHQTLQILGGIVDPDKDPDADHAGTPASSEDPTPSDETPVRTRSASS
jgi:hypothetical protein